MSIDISHTRLYKAMLVEDEETILDALSLVIPWEELGFRICGLAASYEEAMQIARQEHPDLMVSDIMLGDDEKTGIELIRQFSVLLPQMQTILLTGYDLFTFAQNAIGYSVRAYLLKPVKEAELRQKVSEVYDILETRFAEEERRRVLKRQMEQSLPFMFDWLVSHADLTDYDRAFGLAEGQQGFLPIIIRFRNSGMMQELYERFLAIEVFIKQNEYSVSPFYNGNHYALLLQMRNEMTLCSGGDVHAFTYLLQEYMDFNDLKNYLIAVGEYSEGLEGIRTGYRKLLAFSEYGSFIGGRKQIYYTDLEPNSPKPVERIQTVANTLRLDTQSGNIEHARRTIWNCLNEARHRGASIGTLRSLAYEAFTLLDEIKAQYVPEGVLGDCPAWGKVEQCSNIEELFACVSQNYELLCHYLMQEHDNKILNALDRIKLSIDRDYSQNLSLEKYANEVYLSPAYLSSSFSEKFGITFKAYLTDVRMEAAKRLLLDSNMKVFQIAEQVGYTDTRYFSQVFRKHTGKTPLAYRESGHIR